MRWNGESFLWDLDSSDETAKWRKSFSVIHPSGRWINSDFSVILIGIGKCTAPAGHEGDNPTSYESKCHR